MLICSIGASFPLVVESEVQVNLTVVENSTVALPFVFPPENNTEGRRLTWFKTMRGSSNKIVLYMENIPRTKWFGEFRNRNKGSLDIHSGSLTIHNAQLSDTDRYLYEVSPHRNLLMNFTINLHVISKYSAAQNSLTVLSSCI